MTPSGLEATACSHPIKDAPVGRAAKRLASRVLDRLLRAPWSQSVARARDGRRSLAAGRLGLGTGGRERPSRLCQRVASIWQFQTSAPRIGQQRTYLEDLVW